MTPTVPPFLSSISGRTKSWMPSITIYTIFVLIYFYFIFRILLSSVWLAIPLGATFIQILSPFSLDNRTAQYWHTFATQTQNTSIWRTEIIWQQQRNTPSYSLIFSTEKLQELHGARELRASLVSVGWPPRKLRGTETSYPNLSTHRAASLAVRWLGYSFQR